ncbi:MAG: toll/interleukin-1 receptor domain-containing protein, partial [Nitrospira sp.]|nr:toll/interleukin-1 receptor domain-containing protein [Nitrospira sp.]
MNKPSQPFDIFLSYHWRDHAQVEALACRLRDQGLHVFLDRWYLAPGQSWLEALESTLAYCRAVAVCLGPGEMGPWQQREQYLALQRQVTVEKQGQTFPVIPVLLPGAEPPLGFLSQQTWVDLRSRPDDPVLLTILQKAAQGEPPGPEVQVAVQETRSTICPYRGLLYFREEDAPFFFGRAKDITQLVHKIN